MNSNSETKTGAGRPKGTAPFSPLSSLEEQAISELRGRGAPWEVIGAILGRSCKGIRRASAGVVPESVQEAPLLDAAAYSRMPGRRPWTDAEDTLLAEAYGPDAPKPVPTGDICRRLHRPVLSVNRRAAILGLSRKENGRKTKAARAGSACRPWTQDEDALLAELWPDNGVLAISRALGREPEDVRRRAARVVRGMSRPVRAGNDWWTAEEDAMIRLLFPMTGPAALAVALGRTAEAIVHRAQLVSAGASTVDRELEKAVEKNYFLKKLAESTGTWASNENSRHVESACEGQN